MTSVASTLVGTTFGMMVFLTPLVPASAQELFALSTGTGLEFYQVDTVKQPTWPLNRHSSALWPEPQTFLLIPSVEVETIKLFNSPLMVLPGFTTTTTGRVLTTAGRIHWLSTPPSVEMVQVLDSPSLIFEKRSFGGSYEAGVQDGRNAILPWAARHNLIQRNAVF